MCLRRRQISTVPYKSITFFVSLNSCYFCHWKFLCSNFFSVFFFLKCEITSPPAYIPFDFQYIHTLFTVLNYFQYLFWINCSVFCACSCVHVSLKCYTHNYHISKWNRSTSSARIDNANFIQIVFYKINKKTQAFENVISESNQCRSIQSIVYFALRCISLSIMTILFDFSLSLLTFF